MGYFDLETAILALGENADPIDAFSIAFGIPQCLIDIGKSAALAFLPSGIVLGISDQLQAGRDAASEDESELKKKLLLQFGFFELETESGTYRFKSDFSKAGMDSNSTGSIGQLGGFTSALGFAIQTGADIYTNYQDVLGTLNAISDCLGTYEDFLKFQKGPSSQLAKSLDPNYATNTFGIEMAKMQQSRLFISDVDEALANCRAVMIARMQNPSLEPEFVDGSIVSGLGFNVDSETPEVDTPIFRLVFGPPKSKSGQFLLSIDGLYYDSQSGGLPTVSGYVAPELAYKFDQDANLGGRGVAVSQKILNTYVDTIFDLTKIDESPSLQVQYDADHFLSVLKGQKSKHVDDLNSQILEAETLYFNDAITTNLKQSLISVIAKHDNKINKRKKQIEVAVKAPYVFGKGVPFSPGEIPINDFSYLKDINLSIAFENQKKLVFKQGEVSGIILPLNPIFVKAIEADNVVQMNHLIVPPVGTGAIVYDNDSLDSNTTVLSLNDKVIKNGLFAIYNFLEGETVPVNSGKHLVLNCASGNNYNNAQLIANSTSGVFSRGLGIPYLGGILNLNPTTGAMSSLGSFVRIPDTTEFQNLAYGKKGFTFESWVHIPGFDTSSDLYDRPNAWGAGCFHKILLACENNGGIDEGIDPDIASYNNNSDIVRGMVIGFTRDIQITLDSAPDDTSANNPIDRVKFFIAPTRSVNASDVAFINRLSVGACASGYEVLKCAVDCSTVVEDSVFNDVSGGFIYVTVTADVENDQVRILCDGVEMAVSSLSQVFGVPQGSSPKIPSFREINSFEYSTSSTGTAVFANGPTIGGLFTPWIVGGGWTDGIANLGFMGSRSGKKSGLNGYVGSVKFYNRPLTTGESLANFEAQRGFFKNIDLT